MDKTRCLRNTYRKVRTMVLETVLNCRKYLIVYKQVMKTVKVAEFCPTQSPKLAHLRVNVFKMIMMIL